MPNNSNEIKATISGGNVNQLGADCYISIPGAPTIYLYVLPEISDSKSAHYNDEPIIGRAVGVKTFSYGDNRTIGMKLHFITWNSDGGVNDPGSPLYNLASLRAIQSAVYPVDSLTSPYEPPPICRIAFGSAIGDSASDTGLCVVLRQYSVSFPTDCAYDEFTKLPYHFDIDTTWDAVYQSSSLPGQSRIIQTGV